MVECNSSVVLDHLLLHNHDRDFNGFNERAYVNERFISESSRLIDDV